MSLESEYNFKFPYRIKNKESKQCIALELLGREMFPEELIKSDHLYGQVVCACEHVSAAEIKASLEGPVPATSIDGVRKRTGAGYGRCQGSLCMAGISFLTATSTGKGPDSVLQTSRGTVGS